MNLLDKFNQVEVKADTRISDADRRYCEAYQQAYDKGRAALRELADLMGRSSAEQLDILKPVSDGEVYVTFLGECSKERDYMEQLRNTHHILIHRIVCYFENTYKVKLDVNSVENNLVPQRPEDSYRFKKEEWTAYTEAMNNAALDYKDILDQIFIQLGGVSFHERALNELKEKCHKAAWNTYCGNRCFEQKKAVISFSYGCSQRWNGSLCLTDGMKDILHAVMYQHFGDMTSSNMNFNALLGYDFNFQSLSFTSEVLDSVKCFKNGRVDVRFTSEAIAREFVETFLGTEV